jgi:hypothetical protein
MEQETLNLNETKLQPTGSAIRLVNESGTIKITIPAKGLKGKGLITVSVIGVWMFTMVIWSILLLMMKPINVLYSVPFWAIGFITLFKSLNMLRLEQTVIIENDTITMRMKRGSKSEERQFNTQDSVVNIVEGPFYSYTGLNKRGQYPAIINGGEAFGFAERSTSDEKAWLVTFINKYLHNK